MARFTAPGSADMDDMQLVLVSQFGLTPFPTLRKEAGVPVGRIGLLTGMVLNPQWPVNAYAEYLGSTWWPGSWSTRGCSEPEVAPSERRYIEHAWPIYFASSNDAGP